MKDNSGSCGCGVVQFKLNSEILNVVNCHCNMCRYHNGSSYSTYVVIPFSALEIIQGNEHVNKYVAGSAQKHFCSNCGTPLFNVNEKFPGACMIYLGTLKDNMPVPKINVWAENKLAWVDTVADISSMAQGFVTKLL